MFLAVVPFLAWASGALTLTDADFETGYSGQPYSPYSYPSPNITDNGAWQVAVGKAKRFVAQLTLDEKVGICTGNSISNVSSPIKTCQGGVDPIPRMNFMGLCYADSDTGVGNGHSYATGFPPGITAASTFNRELIRARAFAIAEEMRVKGVHSVLGPVLANGRSVGGGTNFEGFGNDPYLIGVAGYESVIGHQAAGVQAEPKQFLGYDGQQFQRFTYSSNMDDKTLHEIEVWPYAEAVRAGAACVMTSYPKLNNTWEMQNGFMINNILKTHLAFQGYTQTDWCGLHSGVPAILAGTDQNMPGACDNVSYFGANYTLAVQNGSVPMWRLDDAAVRIMTPFFWLGQDRNYPQVNLVDDPRKTIANAQRYRHLTVAREVASAGMVLLKNTQGKKGLPLRKPNSITLFGPAAGQNPWGPNQYLFGPSLDPNQRQIDYSILGRGLDQGTLAEGGGSGSTFYSHLVDPISAIQQRAARDLSIIDWSTTTNTTFAAAIAKRGTVCLPVVSSFSGEGFDRNLTLSNNGDAIVEAVANNCDNTIVLVQAVGPADMEKWADHPNITAILWVGLAGEELGPALTDILYGDVNPSGRLPFTIARNVSDYAQPTIVETPVASIQINYTEGVSVDYRGFEKNGVNPRYWFGHGLSYSNFTYQDLLITVQNSLSTAMETPLQYVGSAPGGDPALYDVAVVVRVNVTNAGPWDGTEIVQLYLLPPAEAENPTKILRGFESVLIRDGETQEVWLYLTRKDISYWNVVQQTWVTPRGEFHVSVGASVNDIRLTGSFTL